MDGAIVPTTESFGTLSANGTLLSYQAIRRFGQPERSQPPWRYSRYPALFRGTNLGGSTSRMQRRQPARGHGHPQRPGRHLGDGNGPGPGRVRRGRHSPGGGERFYIGTDPAKCRPDQHAGRGQFSRFGERSPPPAAPTP